MADGDTGANGGGWKVVEPRHVNVDSLSPEHREKHEFKCICEWEKHDGHWSGLGKHPSSAADVKKLHDHKFSLADEEPLGSGSFGEVDKVTFRGVHLARKRIFRRKGRAVEQLREEANVMERLDHRHIVRLVGTYTFRRWELYILVWPVATCNLMDLLKDLDDLRWEAGDRAAIVKRLESLDMTDLSAFDKSSKGTMGKARCPLRFLQSIMGCLSQALTHIHDADVRHMDLKPSNILVNPRRVYLADFGISKRFVDGEETKTLGLHGSRNWMAPEINNLDSKWSRQCADVYSLGLVFLAIATVMYGGSFADLEDILYDDSPELKTARLQEFQDDLMLRAYATGWFSQIGSETIMPRPVLSLTQRMLDADAASRPRAREADVELVSLGGIDQIYHSDCCRKTSHFVNLRIDERFAKLGRENQRLQREHEQMSRDLRAAQEARDTFKVREENERRRTAEALESKAQEARKRGELEVEIERLQRLWGKRRPRADVKQSPAAKKSPGQTMTPPARPIARVSDPSGTWARSALRPSRPSDPAPRTTATPSPMPTTPVTPSAGTPMKRVGSVSRLPIPVTPTPRSGTPALARDQSDSTQTSMSSSIFSRRSIETVGTPWLGSPAQTRQNTEAKNAPAWGILPPKTATNGLGLGVDQEDCHGRFEEPGEMTEQPAPVVPLGGGRGPMSPIPSLPRDVASVASSPATSKAQLASSPGIAPSLPASEGLAVPKHPASLVKAMSWAEVAHVTGGATVQVSAGRREREKEKERETEREREEERKRAARGVSPQIERTGGHGRRGSFQGKGRR